MVYKLYYFNARSRGELIRLAFAAAEVEYEDIRFRLPTNLAVNQLTKEEIKPEAGYGRSSQETCEEDDGHIKYQKHGSSRILNLNSCAIKNIQRQEQSE